MQRKIKVTTEVDDPKAGSTPYSLVWEVEVCITPHRPATYYDPPEGGIEIDSDPELIEVWSDIEVNGEIRDYEHLQERYPNLWEYLERYHQPTNDQIWERINEWSEEQQDLEDAAAEEAWERKVKNDY